MLQVRKISKIYQTGNFKQKALDDVSVNFRKCEFASILGPSGSGKTTFLNIIGGLDQYDKGDLIINGTSTKLFKDRDWDSYRNHKIGFVFQSYNLISHQSILNNVCLALTLSGETKKESIKKAKEALIKVGLKDHMYKKPNQLSGGQMQRVAIARALVNDPDILLADEPTGALDSETSIQIMSLLGEIAKSKLVIMVTHNPELAEEYSRRIIKLKDGHIIEDTNPFNDDGKVDESYNKQVKTKMKFKTALGLSFNNLMTKKGRTTLVSLAGSIGIIGIALILAVSTGFQNYIDSIQEETLTSYPLTIYEESSDITSTLLALTTDKGESRKDNKLVEKQYINTMLSNVSTNDLKSFKESLEKDKNKLKTDLSNIQYGYSVSPNIYTIDGANNLAKLNPSSLFSSVMGNSSLMSSMSSYSSIYQQMVDDISSIENQYDVLAGTWPKEYNEMIIVLSESGSISDLLVYSLGIRDTSELTDMITKIMSGETVENNNKPLTLNYDDLLNLDLRLINNTDTYKYNKKYKVYENMEDDTDYMKSLYNKSTKLKIVGIVAPKKGVTATSLTPGVAYTSKLTNYIINYSSNTKIVKEQIANEKVDVFSGKKFSDTKYSYDFKFEDLVKVDNKKLESAFNVKIDQNELRQETEKYMSDISTSITNSSDIAYEILKNIYKEILDNVFENIEGNDCDNIVNSYFTSTEVKNNIEQKIKDYLIPYETYEQIYSSIIKGLMNAYLESIKSVSSINDDNVRNTTIKSIKESIIDNAKNNEITDLAFMKFASKMAEAKMQKDVLTKVGELTSYLSNKFADSFNIDPSKFSEAFKLNFSQDELSRVVSAMMNPTETTAKSNLISLGYQNITEPTYIAIYFNSFDGKENFLNYIEKYNSKNSEEKKINYTDTAGILMSSVKTIVNAVSYVLIAFVSISLVVSSIMIGVITYISVYERTKEIGVLRAIGASKHNISSIFNAETFIIGLLAGLFGIGITYIFIPIINAIIHNLTGDIPLRASLPIKSAIILIILSIILTLIGGLIPAKKASRKDPVEALRSE